MRRFSTNLLVLSLCFLGGYSTKAAALTGKEILEKVDDLWRGNSSAAIMEMHVVREHFERTLVMKAYSKGSKETLIRIVRPKKEAGLSWLKSGDSMWQYDPKKRLDIFISASMMMGEWNGSHFTNDDLVKESRLSDDYNFSMTFEGERDEKQVFELTLMPKPDAVVVWGKIVLEIQKEPLVPIWEKYYDEKERLVREATFSDIQKIAHRTLPMRFRMQPTDKPGEYTELLYKKLQFNIPYEEDFFSVQNMKRLR